MKIQKEIIKILSRLQSFETTADNESEIKKAIAYCKKYLSTYPYRVGKYEKNGKPSLVFYRNKKDIEIMINGHVDVVPAEKEMFKMKVRGNRAYGRGVYDMKGAVAVYLKLFRDLARSGKLDKVALMLVSDEEVGGHAGSKYLLKEKGFRAKFFVAGEPTNFDICTKQKGIVWIKFIAKGKSAHGSKPWEGDNANVRLIKCLNSVLEKYKEAKKEVWKTTFNFSKYESGDAVNKVPDYAEAYVDIRFVPSDSRKFIKDIADRCRRYKVKVEKSLDEPTMNTSKSDRYIFRLRNSVKNVIGKNPKIYHEHFGSDGRFYSAEGIPSINFGLEGDHLHGDKEYLKLDSLVKYYEILRDFLEGLA